VLEREDPRGGRWVSNANAVQVGENYLPSSHRFKGHGDAGRAGPDTNYISKRARSVNFLGGLFRRPGLVLDWLLSREPVT